MQVLWHTMKERGKAFTKPPAVPMCPRSRGQMNRGDYLYHWLREEKEKKKMSVKSSSKHTRRSDSPIDSLSVQVSRSGWRGDVCGVPGFEDKWTVTTKNRPQGALPGVRCGLSLLFRSCSSEMLPKPSSATNNFQFNLNNNSNRRRQQKQKQKKKDSRQNSNSVHSGKGSARLCGSYRPPGLSVTINLLSANLLPF